MFPADRTMGLLFVRFLRPKAQIHYATNAVVAVHNGQATLMIRIANVRLSLITDTSAHLGMVRAQRTEGQVLRQIYELPLVRARVPPFPHPINAASPLQGYDAVRPIEDNVHLWVSLTGHDSILATTIVDTWAYEPAGMRYTRTISADAEGHPTSDLRELSGIERDAGPEGLESGWVDAR